MKTMVHRNREAAMKNQSRNSLDDVICVARWVTKERVAGTMWKEETTWFHHHLHHIGNLGQDPRRRLSKVNATTAEPKATP